jgi:hypothetical protein
MTKNLHLNNRNLCVLKLIFSLTNLLRKTEFQRLLDSITKKYQQICQKPQPADTPKLPSFSTRVHSYPKINKSVLKLQLFVLPRVHYKKSDDVRRL